MHVSLRHPLTTYRLNFADVSTRDVPGIAKQCVESHHICHLHISLIPAAVAASSKKPLCNGETNEVLMNKNPLESSKEDFYIFLSMPLFRAIINWVRDYKPCWLSV